MITKTRLVVISVSVSLTEKNRHSLDSFSRAVGCDRSVFSIRVRRLYGPMQTQGLFRCSLQKCEEKDKKKIIAFKRLFVID